MTATIVYNADGTWAGKATYAFHKIAKHEEHKCSACDITHGLSLSEQPEWVETKRQLLQLDGVDYLQQLHRDELPDRLATFVRDKNIKLPCVLLQRRDQDVQLLLGREQLDSCQGNASSFAEAFKDALTSKL